MFVAPGAGVPQALVRLWQDGAVDLRARLTPDPAGVSAPIKCLDRYAAADRLDTAASRLEAALAHDENESWVRQQLAALWPEFVAGNGREVTKARALAALKGASPLSVTTGGILSVSSGLGLKSPRSYGTLR